MRHNPTRAEIALFEARVRAQLDANGVIYQDITHDDGCIVREYWNGKGERFESMVLYKPPNYDSDFRVEMDAYRDKYGSSGLHGFAGRDPRWKGLFVPHSFVPRAWETDWRAARGAFDDGESGDSLSNDPDQMADLHAYYEGETCLDKKAGKGNGRVIVDYGNSKPSRTTGAK